MHDSVKTVVFWLVVVVSGALLWTVVKSGGTKLPELVYSDFLMEVEAGKVAEVVVRGDHLTGKRHDQTQFEVVIPQEQAYTLDVLRRHEVKIRFASSDGSGWAGWLDLLPLLLLAGLWLYMIRQMQRAQKSGTNAPGEPPQR